MTSLQCCHCEFVPVPSEFHTSRVDVRRWHEPLPVALWRWQSTVVQLYLWGLGGLRRVLHECITLAGITTGEVALRLYRAASVHTSHSSLEVTTGSVQLLHGQGVCGCCQRLVRLPVSHTKQGNTVSKALAAGTGPDIEAATTQHTRLHAMATARTDSKSGTSLSRRSAATTPSKRRAPSASTCPHTHTHTQTDTDIHTRGVRIAVRSHRFQGAGVNPSLAAYHRLSSSGARSGGG